MFSTISVLSSRGYQPLIKFLGKRVFPSAPSTPHAHPAAPVELQQRFSELKKFEASETRSDKGRGAASFSEFWEAPERFWRPKAREITDAEVDAILSGGASLH